MNASPRSVIGAIIGAVALISTFAISATALTAATHHDGAPTYSDWNQEGGESEATSAATIMAPVVPVAVCTNERLERDLGEQLAQDGLDCDGDWASTGYRCPNEECHQALMVHFNGRRWVRYTEFPTGITSCAASKDGLPQRFAFMFARCQP